MHEAIHARLGEDENRYTASRRALVEVLISARRPLSVDAIVTLAADLPRASVYRNLAVLEQSGVVRSIAGHDEFTRFELAEDLMGHHHHLACRVCGVMVDVELPGDVEAALEQALARVARRAHFRTESHRLDMVGICASCGNKTG